VFYLLLPFLLARGTIKVNLSLISRLTTEVIWPLVSKWCNLKIKFSARKVHLHFFSKTFFGSVTTNSIIFLSCSAAQGAKASTEMVPDAGDFVTALFAQCSKQ
jgi:hypothetical protein